MILRSHLTGLASVIHGKKQLEREREIEMLMSFYVQIERERERERDRNADEFLCANRER